MPYRFAKTAELDLLFDWLKLQLEEVRKSNPDHSTILDVLEKEYQAQENKLALLHAVLALNDPSFHKRADSFSQDLHRYIVATSNHYIAGLQCQNAHARRVRKVLLGICSRLHFDWIKDILARLHRDLALLPEYRGNFTIPIFFGPPHLFETVLEVAGVYHEVTHSLAAREPTFVREMKAIVHAHFRGLKHQAGPMPPAQKELRDKEYDAAAVSWNELWLTEIFCDVFSGYVCGPANLASMLDLGAARGSSPHLLAQNSHPPNGARFLTCYHALSDQQRQHPTVQKVFDAWQQYCHPFTPAQDYRLRCSDSLLRAVAEAINNLIAQRLPDVPRFVKLPPDLTAARTVAAGISLEDLVNAGVTMLFEAPGEFPAWQRSTRQFIA